MTIDYTNGSGNGLFDILGKVMYGIEVKNTARGTTVATAVGDAIAQYKLKTDADLQLDRDVEGLADAEETDRTVETLIENYRSMAQALIIGFVRDDSTNERLTLEESLEYLVEQMGDESELVDASATTVVVTPDGGNAGDLQIVTSNLSSDYTASPHFYAETIKAEVTATGETPTIDFVGERAARSKNSRRLAPGVRYFDFCLADLGRRWCGREWRLRAGGQSRVSLTAGLSR